MAGVSRHKFPGLQETGDGVFRPALCRPNDAEIVVRLAASLVDAKGLAKMTLGIAQFSLLEEYQAQVHMGGLVCRIDPEDLPEILHGLIQSALLHQQKPAVDPGHPKLGIDQDRLPKVVKSACHIAATRVADPQAVKGQGEVFFHLDGFQKMRHGLRCNRFSPDNGRRY